MDVCTTRDHHADVWNFFTQESIVQFVRYHAGRGWLYDRELGLILAEEPSDVPYITSEKPWTATTAWIYRTAGEPSSMRHLLVDFGLELREAAAQFDISLPVLMAMIGIEATRLKGDRVRFNPRCVREEPGYRSDEHTPDKVSPGLAQTLLSTAQEMLPQCQQLPQGRLTREDLFVPRYSILLGAAYIRKQINRFEKDEAESGALPDDPVFNACAAYNAGSVRQDLSNHWHLRTYGEARVDKFIAYHNDAFEVVNAP
jgi:hypothetical protein